jgi:dinuclear metal center YbgI/SA1388 family protein
MSLKLMDVKDIMEEYAPLMLQEGYDNSGLMVGDLNAEITSILIALDCTLTVIEEAKNKGCNLILTHHPLFFKRPNSLTMDSLIGKKINEIIKNNINVYSSHTNLDKTGNGINDIITEILGYKEWSILDNNEYSDDVITKVGIGRLVKLDKEITLEKLLYSIKEALNIKFIRYSGSEKMVIKKIAIINGSGQDYFEKAKLAGAECIITGDTTYHNVSDLLEQGISVIDAGHFETEWPAMKNVGKFIENKMKAMGFKNLVLISEECKSPYKIS